MNNKDDSPAFEEAVRLWQTGDRIPQIEAGHTLMRIGTDAALDTVAALLDASDRTVQHLAVGAMFARHGGRAYDVLWPRFNTGVEVRDRTCLAILTYLAPSGFQGGRAPRYAKGAVEALQDQRWLDLCADLCRDAYFGNVARDVLLYAPADARDAALKGGRLRRAALPALPPARTLRDGSLRQRYEAGAFEDVWREIRSFRQIEGEFREEVLEVAESAMRRVAANVDLISERLRDRGWLALSGDRASLRTPPNAADEGIFREIESITETPLPPTLLAFWKVVGGVNWIWDYKQQRECPDLGVGLAMDQMDPLCIDAPGAVTWQFEDWTEQKAAPDRDLVGPFQIDLSPDYLHKADISGGAPYAIIVPFFGADPSFAFERHGLPFLDYLRLSFRWGGFPRLQDHAEREDVRSFLSAFTAGLAPF